MVVEGEDDLEEAALAMLEEAEERPELPVERRPARPSEWEGMSFYSATERRIAEALERANAFYFPNPRGRVGVTADHRATRKPDFLVCHEGRWGILEVDGDDYHEPSRAAEDHERDRRFREHGCRVVERFGAAECWELPDDVVARFLRLLALNG